LTGARPSWYQADTPRGYGYGVTVAHGGHEVYTDPMAPQRDPEGRNPPLRVRIPPDVHIRANTRAAQKGMTIAAYITDLIRKDAEEIEHIFHRIDSPANGGR